MVEIPVTDLVVVLVPAPAEGVPDRFVEGTCVVLQNYNLEFADRSEVALESLPHAINPIAVGFGKACHKPPELAEAHSSAHLAALS